MTASFNLAPLKAFRSVLILPVTPFAQKYCVPVLPANQITSSFSTSSLPKATERASVV